MEYGNFAWPSGSKFSTAGVTQVLVLLPYTKCHFGYYVLSHSRFLGPSTPLMASNLGSGRLDKLQTHSDPLVRVHALSQTPGSYLGCGIRNHQEQVNVGFQIGEPMKRANPQFGSSRRQPKFIRIAWVRKVRQWSRYNTRIS